MNSHARKWILVVGIVLAIMSSRNSDGAAPAGRFTATNGTVTDTKTGLTWQQSSSATGYTWGAGMTYCSSNTASLPGTGWRLPSVKELQSIVDFRVRNPAIDSTFFMGTYADTGEYWSSTLMVNLQAEAWTIVFGSLGNLSWEPVTSSHYVRCVR